MEALYFILGVIMIYSWFHGIVIVAKNIRKVRVYEQIVLWVGLTSFILFLMGSVL